MITGFFGGAIGILVCGAAGYGVRCYRDRILAKHPTWARFLPECAKQESDEG